MVNTARRLIQSPHVFDQVVVTLSGIIVFGAYVTAYAYVSEPLSKIEPSATIGQSTVLAGWLVLVAVLFAEFAYGVRNGRPWDRALPEGYVGSLAAALAFGVAWLVDTQYWTPRRPLHPSPPDRGGGGGRHGQRPAACGSAQR